MILRRRLRLCLGFCLSWGKKRVWHARFAPFRSCSKCDLAEPFVPECKGPWTIFVQVRLLIRDDCGFGCFDLGCFQVYLKVLKLGQLALVESRLRNATSWKSLNCFWLPTSQGLSSGFVSFSGPTSVLNDDVGQFG
eukprot:06841.XXX_296249_296656_1 [CDS] Oithona nana genome sequencing.